MPGELTVVTDMEVAVADAAIAALGRLNELRSHIGLERLSVDAWEALEHDPRFGTTRELLVMTELARRQHAG